MRTLLLLLVPGYSRKTTLRLTAGALLLLLGFGYSSGFITPATASAQPAKPSAGPNGAASSEGFALQVSPSPLIATVKPGTVTTLELRVRNTSSSVQDLKMGLRAFSINNRSGKIDLQEAAPKDIGQFVRFEKPLFTIAAGEILTQRISVDIPSSAGFSYSFAIAISQQNPPTGTKGTTNIRGSVAVFTLLNVDKPGATRKLELESIASGKRMYEYLPAQISFTLKNSGNTLVQPKGTLYIQRKSSDTKPLAAIALNENGGFILPGSSRTLDSNWNDGFPHYKDTSEPGQPASRQLVWQSGDASKLRIGRYVAKVVAVYDDGRRDVPLSAEVTFWVIPWRILLVMGLIVLLLVTGIVTTLRKSGKALGLKVPRKTKRSKPTTHDTTPS